MTRVLFVEDSVLARRLIAHLPNFAEGLEIVPEASDPYVAREHILALEPDVVVLDLEMSRMDGLSFLQRLLLDRALPVVVCSSPTPHGAEVALRALAAGAVAVVPKPAENQGPETMARTLAAAVLMAAEVPRAGIARCAVSTIPPGSAPRSLVPPRSLPFVLPPASAPLALRRTRAIGIGASTGGTVAIETIVQKLGFDSPPVLVVQHLPPYVLPAFAEHLARRTQLRVEIARDGTLLRPGLLLLSPGSGNLLVERAGGELRARLAAGVDGDAELPTIDALFHSLAESARAEAIGVLLTGAGRDGAEGLFALRRAGARTLVQNAASSLIWGMPKAAIELGAALEVLPLERMAVRIQPSRRARPLTLERRRA